MILNKLMAGKCLLQYCRSIRFKHFWLFSPHHDGRWWEGGLRMILKRLISDTNGIRKNLWICHYQCHEMDMSNMSTEC